MRVVIAVDGLAGSGKTTLSRLLAEHLGFAHLNSGLVYRAVGLLSLRFKGDVDDAAALTKLLDSHTVQLKTVGRVATILLDGHDVTGELRSPDVSEATSKSSRHPEVRVRLLSLQREAFAGENIVAEGRDMGTVVFPQSNLKFFIEADPEVRVARRMSQLHGDNLLQVSDVQAAAHIRKEIVERDERDRGRLSSPTVAAPDAIHVDNSVKPLHEVIEQMLVQVKQAKIIETQ